VLSVAQSIGLHDANDIWTAELPIEFEIVLAPVHTVYYIYYLGHISSGEPSSQRRVIGSSPFLSATTFHCRAARLGGSRSCRSLTLSDVPSEITADVFAGRKRTYFILRCHKNSKVQKYVEDFEILVAKSQSLSNVENCPIFQPQSCILSFVCWSSALCNTLKNLFLNKFKAENPSFFS
jgi:hypothetical protein